MGTLHFGTSSWSAKGWVGPFYPEGTQPRDFLAHYAGVFGAVEADTTYYRVPSPSTVEGWRSRTPDGFQVCAKFPGAIVHGGQGKQPDPDVVLVPERVGTTTDAFLATMDRLGDRAGPLVLQFPYFNRAAFPGLDPFLERLDAYLAALPDRFRYAVEVRNKAWLVPQLTEVLRRHRAALVLIDLAYMPHPADWTGIEPITTDFLYARLIGDRKAVDAHTTTFDRVVIDQTPRLVRWAGLLQALGEHVDLGYVMVNNHFAGHAPATVRELRGLVEGENDRGA